MTLTLEHIAAIEARARKMHEANGPAFISPERADDMLALCALAREGIRMREALTTIRDLLSAEIKARFGTDNRKSEAEVAGSSRIYPLLSPPRNIARAALTGEDGRP